MPRMRAGLRRVTSPEVMSSPASSHRREDTPSVFVDRRLFQLLPQPGSRFRRQLGRMSRAIFSYARSTLSAPATLTNADKGLRALSKQPLEGRSGHEKTAHPVRTTKDAVNPGS